MASDENPLLDAAGLRGLDGFESKWLELLETPPPAAVFLEGLAGYEAAANREVATPLLTLLLESCKERGRHEDVVDVVEALLPLRPKRVDLMAVAREALMALFADEPWGELFLKIANLQEGGDVAEAIEKFGHLRNLLPGKAVYHGTGWGEGVIISADTESESLTVRFRSDERERTMPFTTGLDVLRPLADDDLRARMMIDAEGLLSDAENDPALLIRQVAKLNKGRCTAKEVKVWLADAVVPSSSWSSWWKKAKAAAARDPWLLVENPARPTFIVRRNALTPEDEVAESLSRARTLADVLEAVRGPLALDPQEGVKQRLLSGLAERLAGAGGSDSERIEAALLLARHEHFGAEQAGEVMAELIEAGRGFGSLLSKVSPAALRREALDAFAAARPQLWSDAVVADLPAIPPTLLDAVTEKLLEAGRGDALANRLHIYLLQPSRQPYTVMRLAKRWAAGAFDGIEGAPGLSEVFIGLMHLAETQAPKAERDDKPAKAIMKSLLDLLLHKRFKLFERFGTECTRAEMERAMGVVARCKAMPADVIHPLQSGCHARWPDLVPRDETPYWESNNIFCTQAGLARREEEYRVMIEVKIPENSEAIGKAAAFGDLSENYEWTAAIEQQRQLTEKAAAMEAEIKLARAIEDQEVAADLVAPGSRVVFEQDGAEKSYTILGPWDVGEGVVSYRAPVAEGMLGAKAGDTVTLSLPSGDVVVTIRSVERVV